MSENPSVRRLVARTAEGPWPEQAAATPVIDLVRARLGERILAADAFRGDESVQVSRDDLVALMTVLRDDPALAMQFLLDLTVVDYLGESPRFEVVYHLSSLTLGHRLRAKVRVTEEDAELPSLTALWASADWMEREAWEFYGVRFVGHPDLRHILLYPEFVGHPLRKDYPKDGEQPRLQLRDHRQWPSPKPPDVR